MKKTSEQKYFLYILKCADESLYTGVAIDVDARLAIHAKGKGSKYVAAHLPFECVHREGPFRTKGEALKREIEIKRMKRSEKMKLIGAVTDT